jgi:hypothetical protein
MTTPNPKKWRALKGKDVVMSLACLDVWKTGLSGVIIFFGLLLYALFAWVGVKSGSGVGGLLGQVFGCLLLLMCVFSGMALSTYLFMAKDRSTSRVMAKVGIHELKKHWGQVLFLPLLFSFFPLGLTFFLSCFLLLTKLGVAGPVVFGFLYPVIFLFSVAVFGSLALWMMVVFFYIPLTKEESRLIPLFIKVWKTIFRYPWQGSLHCFLALLVSGVSMVFLLGLFVVAFGLISFLAGQVGDSEYTRILLSMPLGIFAWVSLVVDTGLGSAANANGSLSVAGWLVSFSFLMILSVMLAFVLCYFQAAGAVSLKLLTQKNEQERCTGGSDAVK